MYNKNFWGDREELAKVPGADEKPEVIYVHWQFLRIWQILWRMILESLYVNTTQISNLWDCWEECVELRKGHLRYWCNQVRMKNGGQILWNVTAFCERRKISCLMGRHPTKRGSEFHLMAQLFHLEQWWNITIFLLNTYEDCVVLKSCQVYSLDMRYTREESGKETY